jgi:hypothetical protein
MQNKLMKNRQVYRSMNFKNVYNNRTEESENNENSHKNNFTRQEGLKKVRLSQN